MTSQKIRVMIVDDSLSIRLVLQSMINDAPDMEVVAMAGDPLHARTVLSNTDVDVITLDVEMPHMDGISFLERLMKLKPLPVIMISTLTEKGSDTAIRALELGAVGVIGKPSAIAEELEDQAEHIRDTIRAAARAKVGDRKPPATLPALPQSHASSITADRILPKAEAPQNERPPIIAIGASTGGTEAIRTILQALPPGQPGMVVTQHISPGFSASFAKRLDSLCPHTVVEAVDKMPVETGHVYIAPGDKHLTIEFRRNQYFCHTIVGEPVNRHRPSVNVLFRSIANQAGSSARAALLTGMGDDGATGLKEIKEKGALTLAQNEESCIVFGMPRVAIELGAAEQVLDLKHIAKALNYTDK